MCIINCAMSLSHAVCSYKYYGDKASIVVVNLLLSIHNIPVRTDLCYREMNIYK